MNFIELLCYVLLKAATIIGLQMLFIMIFKKLLMLIQLLLGALSLSNTWLGIN